MAERHYHIEGQGQQWRLLLLEEGQSLAECFFDDHDSALAVATVWLSDDEADIQTILAPVSG